MHIVAEDMMTSDQNMALNRAGQTYNWETDDLPFLRLLMSKPLNIRQRQMQIIRKFLSIFGPL